MRVRYIFSAKKTGKSRKPSNTNQHKIAFPKLVREVIQLSDIILEVLDARFIDKTRNKELEEEVARQGKKLIFVLNKADLINVNELKMNYDMGSIEPYVLFSIKNKIGRARLRTFLNIEAKKIKFEEARVGVIGYPNTGKSSLINVLSGGRRAETSPKAGCTKHLQKIRLSKNILIWDSPGVLLSSEENSLNPAIVKKHTEIGAKDYLKVRYPDFVVNEIMKESPTIFDEFYGVDSGGDVENLLDILGRRWGFLSKGGVIDTDRTSRRILKDWQEGKIRKGFGK